MMIGEINRLAVVRDLLTFSTPLKKAMTQLSMTDWDYDGIGVELTKKHIAMALRRYIQGELSESDIENWANQIEGREDVRFAFGHEQEVEDLIFELANPTLTYPLSIPRAKALLGTGLSQEGT